MLLSLGVTAVIAVIWSLLSGESGELFLFRLVFMLGFSVIFHSLFKLIC